MSEENDALLSTSLKNWAVLQQPPDDDLHIILRQARINKAISRVKEQPSHRVDEIDHQKINLLKFALSYVRIIGKTARSMTSSQVSSTEAYNIASSLHLANSLRSVS